MLTGELAYHLYETYGFPLEILLDEARANQVPLADNLDDLFSQTKQLHLKQSQAGLDQKFKGGLADHSARTTAYHTATHLIHQALRRVLGEHVAQKGSNITPERLRFDFSHPQPLTTQQLAQVEQQVNDWIEQSLPVTKITLEKAEALKSGALAFFAERYPNQVDVYVIRRPSDQQLSIANLANNPDIISMEVCGGPHVTNTKEIGKLSLFKEKSVSAGVRRVYAKVV
ncbi:MAG: Alanine--tRNA ligase [Microgenomates group bacterium ADurb.Bin238]|nr:MAG: Alanine--tRNA ligase [Microgenomates group bacterium ADurb.Bin238]